MTPSLLRVLQAYADFGFFASESLETYPEASSPLPAHFVCQKVRSDTAGIVVTRCLHIPTPMLTCNIDDGAHPAQGIARLFDLNLGGGALLDIGIYPLAAVAVGFDRKAPTEVKATGILHSCGADVQGSVALKFGQASSPLLNYPGCQSSAHARQHRLGAVLLISNFHAAACNNDDILAN